jgi:L-iditol 2-dehydrogenase
MGAGAIGLLAAMVLRLRGFEVSVVSREPETSARARLVRSLDTEYSTRISRKYDLVVEAAGARQAAQDAAGALAPLGVMVVLGAKGAELPLIGMIVNNQVVAGSVNAGPGAFAQAVQDLPCFPRAALNSMVRKLPFSDWSRSIGGPVEFEQPKLVHIMD